MLVKAHARHIHMSSRKVRLVIDLIRGARATKAQTQLQFTNKAAAEPVLKLLNSAIANAEHNFHLSKDDLIIKAVMANEGPTMDRWQPRAHGRAFPIRKRTTHITIVLEDIPAKAKQAQSDEKPVSPKKASGTKKPVKRVTAKTN